MKMLAGRTRYRLLPCRSGMLRDKPTTFQTRAPVEQMRRGSGPHAIGKLAVGSKCQRTRPILPAVCSNGLQTLGLCVSFHAAASG